MMMTRVSKATGKVHTRDVPCTQEQYDRWINGEKIQEAMPDVLPEDREFVISGTTPEEWAELFKGVGEEE